MIKQEQRIFDQACKKYGVTVEEVYEQDRRKERVKARRYICAHLFQAGYTKTRIATVIKRNHATVINLLKDGGVQYLNRKELARERKYLIDRLEQVNKILDAQK